VLAAHYGFAEKELGVLDTGKRKSEIRNGSVWNDVEEGESKLPVKELLRYGIDNATDEEFRFPLVAAPSENPNSP